MYRFFSIFIFIFYLVPILLVGPVDYTTFIPIFIICGYYTQSIIVTSVKPNSDYKLSQTYGFNLTILRYLIILYFILRAPLSHQIINAIFQNNFSDMALSIANERYSGEEKLDWFGKLGVIVFIAYATGLGQSYEKGMGKGWHVIFLIMIFIESAGLSRAGPLIAIMCYINEQIIKHCAILSKLKYKEHLKKFIWPAFLMLILFVFSAYMRVFNDPDAFDIVVFKIGEYTLPMYINFKFWLYSSWNYTFGCGVFAGVCKIFGYTLPQGIYEASITEFGESNIFTVLRPLIEDFTPIGAFLFFVLFGYLCKKRDNNSFGYKTILGFIHRNMSLIIIFLFYSPFVFFASVIGYNLPYLILCLQSKKT